MSARLPLTTRASLVVSAAAVTLSLAVPAFAQEKVLRIAMTAADIPRTLGQPDQGFEGNRFTGIPMYDALTHWDLSKADAPSVLIPGLATVMGGGRQGQDQVGLQAAPRREVPRRLGLQRRRRGLERAQGARQGRAAVRRRARSA